MINNLKESWNTGSFQKDAKFPTEDGCLFMINFSNSGDLLAATTGFYSFILQINDFE